MTFAEGLGWLAASLVLTSFYLKTIMSLRVIAACSNVAFIAYALKADIAPILVLHALLLPLNIYRLAQNFRQKIRISNATSSDSGKRLMLPYMRQVSFASGSVIFSKGGPSDQIYFVIEGMVELIGQCETRGHGDLLGLLGVFTSGGVRLDTAITSTPVKLGVMSRAELDRILPQDPALNRYILKSLAELSHKYSLRNSIGPSPVLQPYINQSRAWL